jgi:NAD dependent epimerase/dehydratase family enzyme
MSWISITDAVNAIHHLVADERLEGPVNVTSPEPVIDRDFIRTLGRVLRRPTPFPLPAAALRLVLGEMAESTLLASARVQPSKLLRAGFRFEHPALEGALRHVLDRPQQ